MLLGDAIKDAVAKGVVVAAAGDASTYLEQYPAAIGGEVVSVYDFGTGYCSLSCLRRFAAGYLKIDRPFVEGPHHSHGDAVVASGIVSLAHAMGLRVVAEGVETGGQLARLKKMGCELTQGFLFAELLAGKPRWP